MINWNKHDDDNENEDNDKDNEDVYCLVKLF